MNNKIRRALCEARNTGVDGIADNKKNLLISEQIFLAGATGFEPAVSALTGPHV